MRSSDIWHAGGGSSSVLWDMLEGPMPRGLLGLGDPDIHLIDGRWTMFLGGFSTTFRNRLYLAELPAGSPPSGSAWQMRRDQRGRARPLVDDPPHGAWDGAGMHTPSHVPATEGQPARIFYTGRENSKHYGPGSRYSIGMLERHGSVWRRRSAPVIEGDTSRPSVLEPLVVHTGRTYRMWYQANPHEVGPGEQPDYELRCVDSDDAITWSEPVVFSSPADGFFDNAVLRWGSGWLMVLARGSNLHGTDPFPSQGLWLTTAATPGKRLSDWAEPQRLIDTDLPGTPDWCAAGTYGPAMVADPSGRLLVFTGGTRLKEAWPRQAMRNLLRGRRPPTPSPYQLAVGMLDVGSARTKYLHRAAPAPQGEGR